MFNGLLIGESLVDASLIKRLTVTDTKTEYPENTTSDQSEVWTLVSFEGEDGEAEKVAELLAAGLKKGEWYTNFTTEDGRVYVIFPGRVFHYKKGDQIKKLQVQRYGQSIGIPIDQLDWQE